MKLQDSASKIVPEQVVEAAWLEIGGLSEDQARLHMQRLSRRQPALLAFVTTFSEDLSKDGAELVSNLYVRGDCSHVRDAFRKAVAERRSKADRVHA